MTVDQAEKKLVSDLINMTLHGGNIDFMDLDLYIKNEWNLFLQNKREIVLNLWRLNTGFKSISDLIFYRVTRYHGSYLTPKGNHNVLKPEWLKLFPSLESLIILDYNLGSSSEAMNGLGFLEEIKQVKNKVKIQEGGKPKNVNCCTK